MLQKTFLASISGVGASQRVELQNSIVHHFPNLSIIDVTRLVSRILELTDQMSLAIRGMAWLSVIAGLVVVYSIARYEVQSRVWEINLLKVLGARFQDIRWIVLIEFGILGFFAALFGVGLSIAMSYGISMIILESIWTITWSTNGLSVLMITVLSMAVALIATRSTLRQKPLALLQSI